MDFSKDLFNLWVLGLCLIVGVGAGARGPRGPRGGPAGPGYLSNGYFGVILTICFGWRRGILGFEFGLGMNSATLRRSGAPAVACPGSSQIGLVCRPVFFIAVLEQKHQEKITERQ